CSLPNMTFEAISRNTVGVVESGCSTLMRPVCSVMKSRCVPSWAFVTYVGLDKPVATGTSTGGVVAPIDCAATRQKTSDNTHTSAQHHLILTFNFSMLFPPPLSSPR